PGSCDRVVIAIVHLAGDRDRLKHGPAVRPTRVNIRRNVHALGLEQRDSWTITDSSEECDGDRPDVAEVRTAVRACGCEPGEGESNRFLRFAQGRYEGRHERRGRVVGSVSVDGYHDLIEQNVASSNEREPVPVAPAGQIDTAEPGWIERVGVRVPVPPDRTVALAVCLARTVVVT